MGAILPRLFGAGRLRAPQIAHGLADQQPAGDQIAVAPRLGVLELRGDETLRAVAMTRDDVVRNRDGVFPRAQDPLPRW
jgi:hypothetical protein